jgi:myo-inositol-1(or 4)-monophosphatase
MTASLIETAVAAAKAGGEVALRSWRNLTAGEVSEKKKNDFVTDADRESEESIVARIREAFPADNFLGEEGAGGDGCRSRT